uniref:Ubiquitin-like-specific protease 1 n=1 Tax=Talaromyces marneffei PM1 TaxID=1077442 RepID=A0A093X852_TALMA
MDSADSSPRSTIPPRQRRRSLLELSEKLRQLADMQVKPETEDIESVPRYGPDHHHSNPSPRLPLKRKQRQDPSYRPSHATQPISGKKQCTDDKNAVDEPMTPESPAPESESPETEDALDSICLDTAEPRPASKTLAMDEENAFKSENIHRSTMPTSPNRERTESPPVLEESLVEGVSFLDTVHQMVNVIYLLNKHPNDMPRTVHQRILQGLHTNQGSIVDSTANQWSDGRMWMTVLERGSATNRRGSVLNMLEYMGASKWYDGQIELAKRTVRTKENKPVGGKGAATHVLNRIIHEHSLLDRDAIINQFSRGKKVRVLVKKLGLGILISPKIWDYTKRNESQFNQLVQDFEADTQRMALLQILTLQVEQLVQNGSTDPEALCGSLRENGLISEDELQEMKAKHQSESVRILLSHHLNEADDSQNPLPNGTLNTAYNQLISRIKAQVFNKQSLSHDDTFIIDHSLKLPADIFYALQPGRWLDCWVIRVAMHIADRPASVHFCESIPVNDIKRHDRIKPLKKPFEAWVKEIAELRKKTESGLESCTPLIFYAPLCHTHSHFTLLEINDGEKVIRHYDSLAERTTINGMKKTRISTLVKDEFGHLGYQYIEMPTPQQSDGWSCGARVIWTFRQRCNGFDIGSWDTVLDSERIQLDIINSLMECIDSNALQKYSRSRERGVRGNASFSDLLGEEGSKQSCVELISNKRREQPHARSGAGRHEQPQDELESLKSLVESQQQKISDLRKELDAERLAAQRYRSLLLQQRLRMRSYRVGEFFCSAIGCGQTFGRDDRVRDHIRKQHDPEHQRLARYLQRYQCPICRKSTDFLFRHLFSCDREQYRSTLSEFYGVAVSNESIIPPKAIFKTEAIRAILSSSESVQGETRFSDILQTYEQVSPQLPTVDHDTNPNISDIPDFAELSDIPDFFQSMPWVPLWPEESSQVPWVPLGFPSME